MDPESQTVTPFGVSAIIPAGNEAHQIAAAIQSVLWADEIYVVVDTASSDGTAEAARSACPRVRVDLHEYLYSAAQKNWAIPRAAHPWIFLLDADERCTPGLEKEIQAVLAGNPHEDAFWVRRQNLYFGRLMRHGGWQTDKVIRLFRKECRYQDRRVHAEVSGHRRLGTLRHPILHDTFRDWTSYLIKVDRYTTWGAEQDFKDGKRAGFVNVALRPAFRLIKQYVVRLGFLDGIPGVVAAYLAVYGVFLKYAKLWDMQRTETGRQGNRETGQGVRRDG